MSDKILAVVALVTMITCISTIPLFVPDPDLIIVVVVVSAMAIWDFWKTLRDAGKGNGKPTEQE